MELVTGVLPDCAGIEPDDYSSSPFLSSARARLCCVEDVGRMKFYELSTPWSLCRFGLYEKQTMAVPRQESRWIRCPVASVRCPN
jgi:hypothetical protein